MIEPAIARIDEPDIGSAFAIGSDTALTAWHCMRDPNNSNVALPETTLRFLNGTAIRATFEHGDSVEDWAILRLKTSLPATLQPITPRREVQAWEDCRCLGFPAATLLLGELGYVPVLGTVSGETVREGAQRIVVQAREVAAHLDPHGMSGGPVIPRSGPTEAVGILSRLLLDENFAQVGGVLFACPAHLFADKPLVGGALDEPIVPLDPEQLSELAREGDIGAAAQLGRLLRQAGKREQAERWLRDAAQGGSAAGAFELGLLIDPNGDLFKKNPARADEALTWFRKAATGGDVCGAATMGVRLRQRGKNDAALPWLEDAVERGDAMAAHTLGLIFEDEGNANEGERWQRFAAERGDQAAARRLGQLFHAKGDLEEARRWLRLAPGDKDAQRELGALGG